MFCFCSILFFAFSTHVGNLPLVLMALGTNKKLKIIISIFYLFFMHIFHYLKTGQFTRKHSIYYIVFSVSVFENSELPFIDQSLPRRCDIYYIREFLCYLKMFLFYLKMSDWGYIPRPTQLWINQNPFPASFWKLSSISAESAQKCIDLQYVRVLSFILTR